MRLSIYSPVCSTKTGLPTNLNAFNNLSLGPRDFQWDCIFIPDGESETFAEMGDRKNEISMRKKAFDKFKEYLLEGGK